MGMYTLKHKAMSGRWILTLVAGLVFLGCSAAVAVKMLTCTFEGETLVAIFAVITNIIIMVFKDYFGRPDRDDNGNGEVK